MENIGMQENQKSNIEIGKSLLRKLNDSCDDLFLLKKEFNLTDKTIIKLIDFFVQETGKDNRFIPNLIADKFDVVESLDDTIADYIEHMPGLLDYTSVLEMLNEELSSDWKTELCNFLYKQMKLD